MRRPIPRLLALPLGFAIGWTYGHGPEGHALFLALCNFLGFN